MEVEKFECWAIVSLFGHNQVAGRCTEQSVAGNNMLRVDVPETKLHPPHTEFYNNAAIYSIHPVTEELARIQAQRINSMPVEVWSIEKYVEKNPQWQIEENQNPRDPESRSYGDDGDL